MRKHRSQWAEQDFQPNGPSHPALEAMELPRSGWGPLPEKQPKSSHSKGLLPSRLRGGQSHRHVTPPCSHQDSKNCGETLPSFPKRYRPRFQAASSIKKNPHLRPPSPFRLSAWPLWQQKDSLSILKGKDLFPLKSVLSGERDETGLAWGQTEL